MIQLRQLRERQTITKERENKTITKKQYEFMLSKGFTEEELTKFMKPMREETTRRLRNTKVDLWTVKFYKKW